MGLDELTVDPSKFSTGEAAIRDAAGTREIRQALNELAFSVAEAQFNQNLTRLDYDGGFFHVFEDTRDVADNTAGLSFDGSVSPFVGSQQTTPTTLTIAQGDVGGTAFSPNGRLAISAGFTAKAHVFDPNLNLITTLTDGDSTTETVAFGPGGRLAVVDNEEVNVYDSNLSLITTLTDPLIAVLSVAFGPNGRIAVGSQNDRTYVYDANLNLITTLEDPNGNSTGVAFSQDGRLAVAAGSDERIYVYDANLNLIATLTDPTRFVYDVAFGPKGRLAAGTGDDIFVYDSNLNLTKTISPGVVFSVSFSPSGRLAAGVDNRIDVYKSNLNLEQSLLDPGESVFSVTFSPNDRLAAGSDDTDAYVYGGNVNSPVFVSFSDLDLSGDGFSSPPAEAVVAHDFTPDSDGSHAIEYTVADQSGNSVVISESEVGDIVDVSSLQDTTLSIQVDVTDSDLNASLNDFAIHFNE